MPPAARQESPLTRMLLGGGEEGGGSRAEFKPQRPWRERLQFLLVSGVPVISLCSLENPGHSRGGKEPPAPEVSRRPAPFPHCRSRAPPEPLRWRREVAAPGAARWPRRRGRGAACPNGPAGQAAPGVADAARLGRRLYRGLNTPPRAAPRRARVRPQRRPRARSGSRRSGVAPGSAWLVPSRQS